jgi:hypothetical protein
VQAGHALVECAIDAAKGECTLTTNEQYLPQIVDGIVMKAKPAKAFALTDSGPQEHRWGKSPVLRRSNWIAAALGLAVLAAFPFLRNSEAMTRGALYDAHRIGAPGGPKDCAACHDPFSSNYSAKCAACHKGFEVTTTHPYAKNADVSCSQCHAEHVFADKTASIMPPMKKSDAGWPQTCLTCHGSGKDATTMPPAAGAVATAKTRLRDQRGEPFQRQLLVDGFSHHDHRVAADARISTTPGGPPKKGQVPVACNECHKPLAAGTTNPAIPTAEFAPVRYDQCLECHADWRVAVHGRDEGGKACLACHMGTVVLKHLWSAEHSTSELVDSIAPELKTVDLPDTNSKWVLKPRGHDFQKDECLKCHVLEKSSQDRRTAIGEKVFRHDHHLRTVTPPSGGELAFSQECRACHDAVAGSTTLAGTPIVNTSGCAKCHVDSEPTPVPVKEGATRRVTDMFHKVHTVDVASLSRSALRYASRDSLSKGCLACHTPTAGEAPMGFKDSANDCKACHTGHENLGEGKCVLCHVDRTPGKNRELNGRLEFRFNEPGIFNPAKATTKTTAAMKPFDHRSAGHANHDCAECHAAANVDNATRVLDVAWPAFDEDACVKCHVAERFHR